MTLLQAAPGPENPGKGENPGAEAARGGFPPYSPYLGPGATQNGAGDGAAAALAAVRAYRRAPPPKPPRKPRPSATLDALLASPLLGVPPDWCEGVALLAGRSAPDGIAPPRWRAFQAAAARLLHDHGAVLHAAGWDVLDLFGLHATAPMTHPPGWGLAWLLGTYGDVLDVAPDVIGLRRRLDGARLAYRRRSAMARAGVVVAWTLLPLPL